MNFFFAQSLFMLLPFFFSVNSYSKSCKSLVNNQALLNANNDSSQLSAENLKVFQEQGVTYLNGIEFAEEISPSEQAYFDRMEEDLVIIGESQIDQMVRENSRITQAEFTSRVLFTDHPHINGLEDWWLRLFYSDHIKRKTIADVSIEKINDTIGYGVYTNKNITRGDFLGIYSGVVKQHRAALDSDYSFRFDIDMAWVVDAEDKGNFTRFVSHSYNPNVEAVGIFYKGMQYVVFIAKVDIQKRQQLFVNYGSGYWEHRGVEPEEMNPPD